MNSEDPKKAGTGPMVEPKIKDGPGMLPAAVLDDVQISQAQEALREYRQCQQERDGKAVEFAVLDERTILAAFSAFRSMAERMGAAFGVALRSVAEAVRQLEVEQQKQPVRRRASLSPLLQPLSARIAVPYDSLQHVHGRRGNRRHFQE